ncbi:acyltransferase family protein [Photobacterium halotolerans]|uniref:Acyltransferase 3 domain-containing protein n=1 Tax=Photobacterium halotolerans TaxID=265726 RepID=A0A0F5VHZ6_9GAMM|nr:acyltransferase [Photobacterium halotolerans]KKD01462.1 hypothetical protein KY46_01135 [Photobacterium halotolerans]
MMHKELLDLIFNLLVSLASIVSCIIVAHFFSKRLSHYFDFNNSSRLRSIDGLRGYLALGVFVHHFVITYYWHVNGNWVRPPQDYFNNFGQVGVAIFFMITGFLFTNKILESKCDIDWFRLLLARVFRIYPLYIFTLLFVFLFVGVETSFTSYESTDVLLRQYFNWLIFGGDTLNSYADTRKIIAGVDWTLRYEWLFYLFLPFVFYIYKSRFATCILISLVLREAFYPQYYQIHIWVFNSFLFVFFLIGGIASRLKFDGRVDMSGRAYSIMSVIFLIVVIFSFEGTFGLWQALFLAVFFIPVALGNNLFGLLTFRASLFMGEVSYSIYLTHGVILYFIFSICFPLKETFITKGQYLSTMPLVALVVLFVALSTFLLVERPAMLFSKKLLGKEKRQVTASLS